jgi:peptidoglycan hydrolase-like protein with peptidoglycan-binding domain
MRADDFLNTLRSFNGTVEDPPGSNQTPIGAEFGWNGQPWCAMQISVACKRLGFPLHEAAVIQIEKHARAGHWGMGWSPTPVRGAAAIFDWKGRGNPGDMHVGGVDELLDGGRFWDLEGNYKDRSARVLRDMTFVRGFATFPFDDATPVAPAPDQPTPPAPAPPPPPPPSPFGEWPDRDKPLIRRGRTKSDVVGYLQRVILAKTGLDLGPWGVDGVFGPITESRVRTIQLQFLGSREVDGIVGPKTWGVIDRLARS